ncbi:MAG TPA: twin-arginine translocase subunit TatB [Thiotrichales bacterium]|nr:twin-arginine translocase subunit TatB [Thiotrichales bacterium]
MFDIGFWEILLILVLALIIIGPERLPGAARKAGYWIGRGRRFVEGVRSEVESEVDLTEFKRLLHNQEVQINELQQQLKTEATKLGDIQSDISGDITTAAQMTDAATPDPAGHVERNDEWDMEEEDLAASSAVTVDEETTVASKAADEQPDKHAS